ncbi:redoxin family protein [Niastella populi]|uniref:Redoxin n=1 Tax=Niastella populi TaxID=550983 RepID=A0A1V9G6F5_9BACT|nr:redoxin family protein [Niastella populi]OQP66150.1 redoxin [Niastella populi]
MKGFFFILLSAAIAPAAAKSQSTNVEHQTLAIGSPAPDFKLPGTDGKTYTLASFKNAGLLVIIFTCNHCPTAQAYEDRIIQLAKDYTPENVAVVAISPNDPKSVRLDELGYSDMSDSFEEMKLRATQKGYNFPYLYDGDAQATAKAYGPIATPHVFIFDKARTLRYQGRIDNVEKPTKTPTELNTRDAIEALLQNKAVPVTTTKVFGCSVKWADKNSLVKKGFEEWAKEPVSVITIDEPALKELLKNPTDKLRLINIWATWCGPCVTEFPDFVAINRMYRRRDFEFISISADDPAKKEKVLKFLQQQQASNTNYLFASDDKYKLIEAIDPKWQGALPYTILVEPGGKIIYGKQGPIDVAEIKRMIVDHKLIGRFY